MVYGVVYCPTGVADLQVQAPPSLLYYTILLYNMYYIYIHYTPYTRYPIVYTIYYILYTIYYILYTIYYILYTIYYILYYPMPCRVCSIV